MIRNINNNWWKIEAQEAKMRQHFLERSRLACRNCNGYGDTLNYVKTLTSPVKVDKVNMVDCHLCNKTGISPIPFVEFKNGDSR